MNKLHVTSTFLNDYYIQLNLIAFIFQNVEWRPDTSGTLVVTQDSVLVPAQLLAQTITQNSHLGIDFVQVHVFDADWLVTSICIVALDYRVMAWFLLKRDQNLLILLGKVAELLGTDIVSDTL